MTSPKTTATSFLAAVLGAFAFDSPVLAIDFQTEVVPILRDRCFKCHGGPRPKGKLSFDKADRLAKRIGTEEDSVIKPGDPAASLMVIKASLPRSDTDAMPPQGRGDPMTMQEMAIVRKWIEEGASLEPGGGEPADPTAGEASMKEADETLYDWSNAAGNSLQAKFILLHGDSVTLAKPDGTEFEYPMEKLSAESQAQAKKLAGE